MKILHLIIKKIYFNKIVIGIKTHDYREDKPYWRKRLIDKKTGLFKIFDEVHFKNGYSKKASFMRIKFEGILYNYGACIISDFVETHKKYFDIRLGEILELKIREKND